MKKLPRVFPRKPKVAAPGHPAQVLPQAKHPFHSDDFFVGSFAEAMKDKLALKRDEGRGGWENKEECSAELLSQLLREHVDKGDPIDVANFCMMLHQRGERICPAPQPNRLRLAVAAVLEADTEFRSNMMPGWEGDPLSDEIDGLRRIFEADPAPQPRVTSLPPSKVREE